MNRNTMIELLEELLSVNDAADQITGKTFNMADEDPEILPLSAQLCRIKDVIMKLTMALNGSEVNSFDHGWFYNTLSRDMEPGAKAILLLEGSRKRIEVR